MFIYPTYARLEGPFLHEPWLSRARATQSRPSLTRDEYVANCEGIRMSISLSFLQFVHLRESPFFTIAFGLDAPLIGTMGKSC